MDLTEILETLSEGKISVAKAQKLLSLYSIEKIEDFAKIDTGRKIRNGIPEVIFAEKKQLSEIKKIIVKVLTKTDLVLVSRIQKKDFEKIIQHCKNNKLKIKKGKTWRCKQCTYAGNLMTSKSCQICGRPKGWRS